MSQAGGAGGLTLASTGCSLEARTFVPRDRHQPLRIVRNEYNYPRKLDRKALVYIIL